ncbi:MAG TPA: hypothetical protein VIY28_01400 [Pseudonocardiaceae bacterium]
MSVPPTPPRAETVDVSADDPDDSAEGTRHTHHPALAAKDEHQERDDDDQIDAEHGQQRDDHRGPPRSGRDPAG